MNKLILGVAIVLVTYANGIVSTKFLNDKNIQLHALLEDNKRLSDKLNQYETEGMHVTVTMYQPVQRQTDSHRTFSQMERELGRKKRPIINL